MDRGYAEFTVRGAYTPLIPLSHSPSGFRHWPLLESSCVIWRSCFSRISRQSRKLQPLRSRATRNPQGPHLMTEPSTHLMPKIEAALSTSCTRPCLPLPSPGSHEILMSRLVLTYPFLVLALIRLLDRKSVLVRVARSSISNNHRGCRVYHGQSLCVLLVCKLN